LNEQLETVSFAHRLWISTSNKWGTNAEEAIRNRANNKGGMIVAFSTYQSIDVIAFIDNAEGKQRVIVELYDKFFKTAFPKMVEKLGIVYTPVEVVDFIIYSVNDILKKEFGRGLTDENVNILDPFTGTGTFITRLIQSAWLDTNAMDGFRKCLERDFSSIYVFNLRGNQRTSGELSRKEGGKIFGSGSRTPIAITILVKKGEEK
jgi:predicted helicase